MQRQNQNQGQKSIFPRQQTPGAGTNGSAQHSGWEQEQGRITGPWLPPEMPPTLHWVHLGIPGVGTVLRQAPAGEKTCGGCENPRQPKCFFWDTVKAWRGNLLLVGCQGDSLWVFATVGSWCYLHFPLAQQARPRHSANLALDVQLEKALGTEGAKFLSKQNSSSACISFGTIGNFQAGEKSKIPHVEAPFPWIFIIIIFKNIFCTETLSAFFIQWKMTQSLCIM